MHLSKLGDSHTGDMHAIMQAASCCCWAPLPCMAEKLRPATRCGAPTWKMRMPPEARSAACSPDGPATAIPWSTRAPSIRPGSHRRASSSRAPCVAAAADAHGGAAAAAPLLLGGASSVMLHSPAGAGRRTGGGGGPNVMLRSEAEALPSLIGPHRLL